MAPALDRAAVAAVDPAGHAADLLDLPTHLRDALWRLESANLQPVDAAGGLVVAGMGGSGVGGRLARSALWPQLRRPFVLCPDYSLPPWVDEDTAVLCASYSGGTEETLAAFTDAGERGATRIVATSGGELAIRARREKVPVIPLPGGYQPRAAVGYAIVVALEVAALAGVAPSLRAEVEGAAGLAEQLIAEWGPDGPEDGEAKALARRLDGTVPVIAGVELTSAAAYRWKTQFNENAKLPAFSSELPELDHNEIVGWPTAPSLGRFAAVFLEDPNADARNQARVALTETLAADAGAITVERVRPRGEGRLGQLVSLVLLGDLVSLYLAVLRGVDPDDVAVLGRFKAELAAGSPTKVGSMSRTIASIIDGTPREDAPGGRLTSTNPANTGEVVAEVLLADAATFEEACRAARAAQPAWASIPAPARGRVIAQVGRLVEDNKEALARLVTREVGKPYAESLGEVQEIVDTCDFFVGEGRRLYGQTVPSEMPDKQLFTFREPVGVAAIITAGNFPVAVPSWYLVPAILCGNAVVWKPAEYSPALGDALARIFHAGGVPGGVLNLVQAEGQATFEGLERALEQRLVDKVGFTGSSAVGSRIGELCGRNLQSPCLELGGKNPLVVMDDADLDLAVEGALFSGFGTAGQRCTSLGVAVVHDSVHDEFVRRLDKATREAPIGDPSQDVLMGPMLSERFAERFEDWLGLIGDHHEVHGSSAQGRITAENPREGFVGDPEPGLFYHPTIVTGVTIEDDLYSTETFGPIVPVTRFETFDEAIELANGHGYGLSSAIYTRSSEHALRFRERVSAGMVSVNNSTSGAEAHLPFGGNGKSGNGSRQSGIWVLDQFTRWQSMNWDYAGKLQKAQMDMVEIDAVADFRLEERAF